jgi:hypothetical protein
VRIYIIEGHQGEFDDYHSWIHPVAYCSTIEAEKRIKSIKKEYKKLAESYIELYNTEKYTEAYALKFSLDPDADLGERSLGYSIKEIELNTISYLKNLKGDK